MNQTELIQAIRLDIASEMEAMYLYDAHAHAADDALARKVLADIRDEEIEHLGELLALLHYLQPQLAGQLLEGESEVKEMMASLGLGARAPGSLPTVGSLVNQNEAER